MQLRFTIWVILTAFLGLGTLNGQDLHFSQFFNSPLTTNPANTGFIPDADYRLSVQYRNQWSSIMTIPYRTFSVSGDAQIFRDKLQNGWLGLGGLLLHDEAGSGGLKSTKIYGSLAYHQMLGNSSLLSAGFNLGWANKRIDLSALKFPDQFDGTFFDNSLPTSVVLDRTNLNYFDMQAGINYAYFPTDEIYINAGYSIHHINKPKESFFSSTDVNPTVPMRHIGFINGILKVSPNVIISPNIYFTTQAGATNLVAGLLSSLNLASSGDKQILAGVYYRLNESVIPMLGLSVSSLRFTFSYDVTTSSLKNFNNYRGASEFSLIKNGFYPQNTERQSLCPKF